jgi:hypothetical protein
LKAAPVNSPRPTWPDCPHPGRHVAEQNSTVGFLDGCGDREAAAEPCGPLAHMRSPRPLTAV